MLIIVIHTATVRYFNGVCSGKPDEAFDRFRINDFRRHNGYLNGRLLVGFQNSEFVPVVTFNRWVSFKLGRDKFSVQN